MYAHALFLLQNAIEFTGSITGKCDAYYLRPYDISEVLLCIDSVQVKK